MKNEELLALEDLNSKYKAMLKSDEYLIGKKVLKLKKSLKKGDFIEIVKSFINNLFRKKNYKDYSIKTEISNCDRKTQINNLCNPNFSGKVAVYTAIFGDYDYLEDPVYLTKDFDYYVFSDKTINSGIWTQLPIPDSIRKFNNNTVKNRYLKMKPYDLFPNYDYSIYIDGNVAVISDLSALPDLVAEEYGIAMHNHVLRNCIYEEVEACILFKKGNAEKLKIQKSRYERAGFPRNYGMNEATIVVANMHSIKGKEIMDNWWNEFIKSESQRDQIALPFVLWNMGINPQSIGTLGNNVYDNTKFFIKSH